MTASGIRPASDGSDSGAVDWAAALTMHQRWLRTVVFARLREPQAVDEVMQEVCLAAVEQRAPLVDPRRVAAWLYRLAVRKSLLYRRQQGRQHKLADRYAQRVRREEEQDLATDPLAWLLADERRQLVREALQRLPHRDVEVLLLKYTESWSYRQLAGHLGISESAVEARLHRARGRLRNELANLQLIEASP